MLGDVCDIVGGGTPSRDTPTYFTGDVPWATPTDITALHGEKFISDTKEHITQKAINDSTTKLVPAGSVLMTSRATIGYTAINKRPMCTNQGFANFIPSEDVDNLYLAYYLEFIRDILIQRASGTTFKEISKSELRKMPIPLPSIEEQKKIGMNLKKITDCIARNRKAQSLSAAYPSSLFNTVFYKETKRRLVRDCIIKPHSNIVKIPKNKFLQSGKYPIIDQGKDLIGGYTNEIKLLYSGDLPVILFGDHTLCLKYVDFPFALGADGVKLLIPSKELDPKYFYYALKNVNIESRGYSRHYKYLLQEQIKIPPISLQKEFSKKAHPFEDIRKMQTATSEKLNLLFASLSNKYFNTVN